MGRRAITVGLLLGLALAGCAKDDGGKDGGATANSGAARPSASSSAAAVSDEDRPLKFSQCMREHGLDWFPDPKPGKGGMQLVIPKGVAKDKVDAAMEACRKYAPDGGEHAKMNPAD